MSTYIDIDGKLQDRREEQEIIDLLKEMYQNTDIIPMKIIDETM